jgi:hypothetical protein
MFSRSAKPIRLSPDPFGPLRAWLPDPRHLGSPKCRVAYRKLERMLSREELLRSRAALPRPEWIHQHIINRRLDSACTETGRWPDQTTITSAINLGIGIVLQNDVRQPGIVQPHVHLAATLIPRSLHDDPASDALLGWLARMFYAAGVLAASADALLEFPDACMQYALHLSRLERLTTSTISTRT